MPSVVAVQSQPGPEIADTVRPAGRVLVMVVGPLIGTTDSLVAV